MTRKEWAGYLAYSDLESTDTKRYRFKMVRQDNLCWITRTLLRGDAEVEGRTEKYALVNMLSGEVCTYGKKNKNKRV